MPIASTTLQHLNTVAQEQFEPCFVYDLDFLRDHLSTLMDQDVVKLWYAVKANPLSAIVRTLAETGFRFDVASEGELQQVLAQEVPASQVLNTGPAKSRRQIDKFIALGVRTFVAESLNQVRWLNEAALAHDVQLQLLLRVQLRWPKGEKNPLGGDSLTPFGLDPQQWRGLYLADYPALQCIGVHIFQWGNMLSADKLLSLWQQMLPPLKALSEQLGFALQVLDLGGGLGVPYDDNSASLQWQDVLRALAQIKRESGVQELWMELGRYAVAECGYYLNPVVEQKENYGEHQLIVSGGINHILRPAVAGQAFPCTLLRESQAQPRQFNIHGPLCTALDSLGTHTLAQDVNENDWLVFSQTGAYGFTESMPFFLCHPMAAEYIIDNNVLHLLRESASANSYLR